MNISVSPSETPGPPFIPDVPPEDLEDRNFVAAHKSEEIPEPSNTDTGMAGHVGLTPKGAKRPAAQNLAAALKRTMEEYTRNPLLLHRLEEYCAMRKDLKKPLTEESFARVLRKLDRLSQGDERVKAALLEQSVQRCWTGIFPLRNPVFADDFQTSAERRLEVDMATEYLAREILFNTRYEE